MLQQLSAAVAVSISR